MITLLALLASFGLYLHKRSTKVREDIREAKKGKMESGRRSPIIPYSGAAFLLTVLFFLACGMPVTLGIIVVCGWIFFHWNQLGHAQEVLGMLLHKNKQTIVSHEH
jgi:amino acid transporter